MKSVILSVILFSMAIYAQNHIARRFGGGIHNTAGLNSFPLVMPDKDPFDYYNDQNGEVYAIDEDEFYNSYETDMEEFSPSPLNVDFEPKFETVFAKSSMINWYNDELNQLSPYRYIISFDNGQVIEQKLKKKLLFSNCRPMTPE